MSALASLSSLGRLLLGNICHSLTVGFCLGAHWPTHRTSLKCFAVHFPSSCPLSTIERSGGYVPQLPHHSGGKTLSLMSSTVTQSSPWGLSPGAHMGTDWMANSSLTVFLSLSIPCTSQINYSHSNPCLWPLSRGAQPKGSLVESSHPVPHTQPPAASRAFHLLC